MTTTLPTVLRRGAAGFSLLEVMVSVAILGTLTAGTSQLLKNGQDAVKSTELSSALVSLKTSLLARVDCDQTFDVMLNGCTNPVVLRDFKGVALTTTAGTGNFANSNLYADNWYIKTTCDTAHSTLRVEAALRQRTQNEFVKDPGSARTYSFADTAVNPIFGDPGLSRTIPLCGHKFDKSTVKPPEPLHGKTCPAGQAISVVTQAGVITCSNVGAAQDCQTLTPATPIAIGIRADGSLICGTALPPSTACPGAGQVALGVSADGKPICGAPVPNAGCPSGMVANGNNATGAPKCVSPIPDSSCAGGTIQTGTTSTGAPICSNPLPNVGCLAGQVQVGNYASGAPKCQNIGTAGFCGGGQVMVGENWDGSPRCGWPVTDAGCGGGSAAAGFYNSGYPKCDYRSRYQDCGVGRTLRGVNWDGSAICDEYYTKGGFFWARSVTYPGHNGNASANPYTGGLFCSAGYHPTMVFQMIRQCNTAQNGGENWCFFHNTWLPGEIFTMESFLCVR